MQVINKKIVIFIYLSIISFGVFKLFNNKEKVVLDDVKLDIQKQDNSFAIYLEHYDGEGNASYIESKENNFPKNGYVFNNKLSGCIDTYGNDVKDVLSYEEDIGVSINTNKTLYCYIYFDEGAGLEIIDKKPKGLNLAINSSDVNWTGMYRFQGQQSEGIENYICFGTTENCNASDDTRDKYMYRIIGIEESGRIKVIKKEALEGIDKWWTDYDNNINWPNSQIYTNINGETFLNKEEYVPKGWEEKIDDNNWLFGSMHSNNTINGARQNGVEIYKIENGQKAAMWNEKAESAEETYKGVTAQLFKTTNGERVGEEYYYINHIEKWSETDLPHEKDAKIGLINLSDYYLSVSNEANCQFDEKKYSGVCNTGWMNLVQNDDKPPTVTEWTMTRYGWNINYAQFNSHYIQNAGYTSVRVLSADGCVRPVFFLKNNVSLISGNGKIDNPFIIQ